MSVLYVTLPLALLLGAIGLFACVRCIASGQYDDLESPALRMLHDDADITIDRTIDRTIRGNSQSPPKAE